MRSAEIGCASVISGSNGRVDDMAGPNVPRITVE